MEALCNVLSMAEYWFNLGGQGNVARHDCKNCGNYAKHQSNNQNQLKTQKETLISKRRCSYVRLLVHRFIFSMLLGKYSRYICCR